MKKIIYSLLIVKLFLMAASAYSQHERPNRLIYLEVDPLAYIFNGYSIHPGFETNGFRFDITLVKVNYPDNFTERFYGTSAFDLTTHIRGLKVDYTGQREDWMRGAFIGIDINQQTLNFQHNQSKNEKKLRTLNAGLRGGYKIGIYRGFYATPWAALWRNLLREQRFESGSDSVSTNRWEWLITVHLGYAITF